MSDRSLPAATDRSGPEGAVAYHRLFRASPRFLWWKPIVAIALGYGLYYGGSFVWQNLLVVVVELFGGRQAALDLIAAAQRNQQDSSNPLVMLMTLGALATMLPAAVLAVRIVGLGGLGQLTSVVGRLRWGWLGRCVIPGIVFIGVSLGLNAAISTLWPSTSDTDTGDPTPGAALAASLVVIVLLVPLQAAGEEFAFRGIGMQTVGSWVRPPIVAIVVPVVGFAFAHSYNWWGKLDVAALGIAFAYLTWRTGGLEAAIVGHVINNVVVFALAAPTSQASQSDGSPLGAGITIVSSAVYVSLIEIQRRRHRPAAVLPVPTPPVDSGSGVSDDPRRLAG